MPRSDTSAGPGPMTTGESPGHPDRSRWHRVPARRRAGREPARFEQQDRAAVHPRLVEERDGHQRRLAGTGRGYKHGLATVSQSRLQLGKDSGDGQFRHTEGVHTLAHRAFCRRSKTGSACHIGCPRPRRTLRPSFLPLSMRDRHLTRPGTALRSSDAVLDGKPVPTPSPPLQRIPADVSDMMAGARITTKRTGRKNRIIGTVSLGGSAAAFFSAAFMRCSRLSSAITRRALPIGVP